MTPICWALSVRACKALIKVREWSELCINGDQQKLVGFCFGREVEKEVKHADVEEKQTK